MSMKHHINQLRFIQIILLSICVSISVYQCYFDLQTLFKDSNGQDLRIFMQFTHDFTLTGQMYYRPSAEGGEISSLFRPTSPVLKFPPAFALQLISFTNQIDNHQFYFFARVIMLISYCVACISLMVYIMKKWYASSPSRYQIFFFIALTTIVATSSDWLRMGIFMCNYEIPIFLLLVVSFFLLKKLPVLSGTIIGYAISVKIYPAFIAIFLAQQKNIRAFYGVFLGVVFFSFLGVLVFGAKENSYYFSEVLPVLLREKPAGIIDNLSLAGAILDIFGNTFLANATFLSTKLLFSALTIILYYRYPRSQKETLEWFSILLILMLIYLPNYWTQYRIFLFPACCIAARKASSPSATATLLLAFCIAAAIPDIHTWSNYLLSTQSDSYSTLTPTTEQLASAFNEGHLYKVMKLLAPYSPWSVFLYFLTKAKALVPFLLWFIVAHEIIQASSKKKDGDQPTSSNPEQ